jgi:hypothetical protein
MKPSRKRTASGAFALAAATLLAFPGAAFATDGSATITPGDLTWGTPATVDFAGTLTGRAQVLTDTQGIDISDLRGSGEGWHVTLTTTQFTTSSGTIRTLATDSATDLSSTGACDSPDPDECLMAQDSAIPVPIPAGSIAPPPVVIQSAEVDSGMGAMTYTHVMQLAIPAVVRAGAYSSTWTYSIVAGP